MRTKKLFAITLLCVLQLTFLPFYAFNQEPTEKEILKQAEKFCARINDIGLTLKKGTKAYKIEKIQQVSKNGKIYFHVADLENKGFIVLSNKTTTEPIIAYSLNSKFSYSPDTTNVLYQLLITDAELRNEFDNQKNYLWEDGTKSSAQSASEFKQWPAVGSTFTGGWIESTWIQSDPYNLLCPLDLSQAEPKRSVVGCTGTAWSQILDYHKPTTGLQLDEDDKYTTRTLEIDIDADSTLHDFPSMTRLNSYLETGQTEI